MSVPAQILILCGVAVPVVAVALWFAFRRRESPEALERRRRQMLHNDGRIGEAQVTGAGENEIFYEYVIQGVHYSASQDVTSLRDRLPEDLERLIGSAGMKYSIKNPVQSMLICEEWSGLRNPAQNAAAGSADVDLIGHQPKNAAMSQSSVQQRVKRQAAG